MPRIHFELTQEGFRIGRKRVARLMRLDGLQGVSRRKGTRTTIRGKEAQVIPDLVKRNFLATAPNRLWVADITCIPTWAGFLYLAVVMDAFSRRIVGWSMETHLRTELVLEALNMALWQRRPSAVIHHSDQGCQYTSIAFGKRCKEAEVRPSTGPPARSATASTMPCARASLPLWSASFSTGAGSGPRRKPEWPSSSSSRPGTTLIAVTPGWIILPLWSMKNTMLSTNEISNRQPSTKTG